MRSSAKAAGNVDTLYAVVHRAGRYEPWVQAAVFENAVAARNQPCTYSTAEAWCARW